jgi:predicted Zn-dependent protease
VTTLARREFVGGLCCCSALALAACAAPVPAGRIEAGYKPQLATDEGGLWQAMEKAERDLKHSDTLIRDADLNAYVGDIVCRLAENNCQDIRTYLVRTPYFNANMAPNGMMQVWTGLLLRTQNEAQLAAVIGHEIGHYLERHSLQRWREARSQTDAAAFIGLPFGAVGGLVTLAALSNVAAFTRDQERRADEIGLELMTKAGYRPLEASRVWEQLVAEEAVATNKSDKSIFFASHPAPEERMATLRAKAAAESVASEETFADRYRRHLAAIRPLLLQDELKLRQYDRSLLVLKELTESGEDGELAFYTGEVHRLRDEGGDRDLARQAYDRAIAHGQFPAETYRSLGLVQLRSGDQRAADASFARYLEMKPDATDRDMIRSYMTKAS